MDGCGTCDGCSDTRPTPIRYAVMLGVPGARKATTYAIPVDIPGTGLCMLTHFKNFPAAVDPGFAAGDPGGGPRPQMTRTRPREMARKTALPPECRPCHASASPQRALAPDLTWSANRCQSSAAKASTGSYGSCESRISTAGGAAAASTQALAAHHLGRRDRTMQYSLVQQHVQRRRRVLPGEHFLPPQPRLHQFLDLILGAARPR